MCTFISIVMCTISEINMHNLHFHTFRSSNAGGSEESESLKEAEVKYNITDIILSWKTVNATYKVYSLMIIVIAFGLGHMISESVLYLMIFSSL